MTVFLEHTWFSFQNKIYVVKLIHYSYADTEEYIWAMPHLSDLIWGCQFWRQYSVFWTKYVWKLDIVIRSLVLLQISINLTNSTYEIYFQMYYIDFYQFTYRTFTILRLFRIHQAFISIYCLKNTISVFMKSESENSSDTSHLCDLPQLRCANKMIKH